MTRQTSVDTFERIKSEGLLSDARFVVYEILFHFGPMTAGEIFDRMKADHRGHSVVKGSACARLTELRDMGVVVEVGEKKWGATGHTGILWDVTQRLPEPLQRRKKPVSGIVQELQEKLMMLENQINELRSLVKVEKPIQGYFFK